MFEQVKYWPKPKWMRWKTFDKKRDKITKLENKYWPIAVSKVETTFGNHFMSDSQN
jgi:hypothetical protein